MKKRVVITGLGVVSPIGVGVGEFWKAALAGSSGISAVAPFDTLPMDAFRSRVVGRVRDFNPAAHLDSGQADRLDRYAQFGLVAANLGVTVGNVTINALNGNTVDLTVSGNNVQVPIGVAVAVLSGATGVLQHL